MYKRQVVWDNPSYDVIAFDSQFNFGLNIGWVTEELKAGVDPQWSQQLPDRNIWQHLAEADGENEEYAEWNRELVESSGYEGMHAIYWDSSWKVTEPNLNTPYLGIIYQGTVDGMRRTDVLVLRYGRGDDKGELLYRLQTESYEAR